jgi:flagellar motor component MotA
MMKKSFILRTVGIVLLILVVVTTAYTGGGPHAITAFFDPASLLFVTIIMFSMLMFAGQLSDYFRAYSIIMGSSDYTLKELKSSTIAVNLAIKICFLSGILGSITGGIMTLMLLDAPMRIGPMAAVAVLTLFYSLFMNTLHYAIKAYLDKEIVYRENSMGI